MKVAGEYNFDAPLDLVWSALQNPTILASILPGCEKLEQTGENEYVGGLSIKIGPVQGKFNGNVKLENIKPSEGYTMLVDGSGPAGFVKATGSLVLHDQGEKTHINYEGDAQVGGRIASVGQRLVESSAKAIIKQSLDALNNVLKAQATSMPAVAAPPSPPNIDPGVIARAEAPTESVAAVPATPPAPPDPRPLPPLPKAQAPSQLEFATGVAKEVAKDMIPAQYRTPLIAIVVIVILLLLYFFSR